MHRNLRSTILLLLLTVTLVSNGQRNEVVPTSVSILHIEPETPVEGMPVLVYFRFINRSRNNLSGWIGADINSGTSAPGVSAVDWEVKELGPKQYTDGAVFVRAPDAGINRQIRVFFYNTKSVVDGHVIKSEPMFQVGQQDLNIAALLGFSLTNFKINHTRARTEDTDYGSLFVSLNDIGVMQPASKFLGNFRDGTYSFNTGEDLTKRSSQVMISAIQGTPPPLNNVFDTGPFAVVPGLNSILKADYFIYNGGSIENSDDFLKGFAEATANPQLFNGPRPGRVGWFSALRVLCPALNVIGACDGFVVADSMMMSTNYLFDVTGTGNATFLRHFDSEDFASQVGCGSTSNYEVQCNVSRLSHAAMMEQYSPIYASVTGGQKINLLSGKKNGRDIIWQHLETIAPDGSFITVTDPAYGFVSGSQYSAPANIPKPLIVILRGISPTITIENNQYDVFSGSELRKITAIVQLIPGSKRYNPAMYNNVKDDDPSVQKENPVPKPPPPPPTKPTHGKSSRTGQ